MSSCEAVHNLCTFGGHMGFLKSFESYIPFFFTTLRHSKEINNWSDMCKDRSYGAKENKSKFLVNAIHHTHSLKCIYLYWITLSTTSTVLPKGPVRTTPHASSVTTGGNWNTQYKLNNTLLTCDQGNFNQATARSQNRIQVTVVRDTCTTTVPPALPPLSRRWM